MSMPRASTLQDLFGALSRAERLLLDLRLATLPHPWFIMLLERVGELGQALEHGLQQGKGVAAGLAPLFKLLASLQGNALSDLRRLEAHVRYDEVLTSLAERKERLRQLSSRVRAGVLDRPAHEVVEENARAVAEFEESLLALRDRLRAVETEAAPNVAEYCRALGDIFSLLERRESSTGLYESVAESLRGIAYAKVAAAGLFDEMHYRGQAPDSLHGVGDALRHYLDRKEPFSPFAEFDDSFYRASCPAVDQLRYNPLEHFVRYGMILRLDPGPAFDTRYYLKSNEDVLDANIQPVRHFLQYGKAEGRPSTPPARRGDRAVASRPGSHPDRDWAATPGGRPCIAVVQPLDGASEEGVTALLDALNGQDIGRPYEVLLMGPAEPDKRTGAVESWMKDMRENDRLNPHMALRLLREDGRIPAISARGIGFEASVADILFTADDGVLPGPSCLGEHLWAHRFGDCHAAVGHARREAGAEHAPATDFSIEDLGVRPLPNGIFNGEPRTVSFMKDAVEGGWIEASLGREEVHGLAAKLYFNGKIVRFLDDATSIFSPAWTRHDGRDPLEALANWNALLERYPDLTLVDRPLCRMQTERLLNETADQVDAPECRIARNRLEAPGWGRVTVLKSKPLRILSYKWHASHQYELFKGPYAFTLVTHIGTPHCNQWDYGTRPRPGHIEFAPLESIDPNEYDFAILPFDEHVLNPEHCAALSPDWGRAFLTMLELTKGMPRAAICHGTPQIYEEDDPQGGHRAGDILPGSRDAVRALLEDVHVVCNSNQARLDWDFAHSTAIWHGFSPEEFPDGRHERDCLTLSRKAFMQRPHCRGESLRRRLTAILGDEYALEYTAPPAIEPGYTQNTQEWAWAKFQNYVSYIADFATYFNPTRTSPMPRSRDEAMMTGTIPVTLRNHDVDQFIQNGCNGFYGESVEELAEHMLWLKGNKRQRSEISRNARRTAMDVFNIDRYLSEWAKLIRRLT